MIDTPVNAIADNSIPFTNSTNSTNHTTLATELYLEWLVCYHCCWQRLFWDDPCLAVVPRHFDWHPADFDAADVVAADAPAAAAGVAAGVAAADVAAAAEEEVYRQCCFCVPLMLALQLLPCTPLCTGHLFTSRQVPLDTTECWHMNVAQMARNTLLAVNRCLSLGCLRHHFTPVWFCTSHTVQVKGRGTHVIY